LRSESVNSFLRSFFVFREDVAQIRRRRLKKASFRDPDRSHDSFDFDFNQKLNRALVFELAPTRFVAQREDVLFLGPRAPPPPAFSTTMFTETSLGSVWQLGGLMG
jgi:DNA replication protein DnaC